MSRFLKKVYRDKNITYAEKLELTIAAKNIELSECKRKINKLTCAMDVLRQIAEMPRRTKEQRLAKACITFLGNTPSAPVRFKSDT